jgi:hypothetical protein
VAAPIKAVAEIGVSITGSRPNLARRPSVASKIPAWTPTSYPVTNTEGSRSIS